MNVSRKTVWRSLALGASGLLLAGLIAPFLSADRFGRQIQRSLEQALGRRVEIGKVHLNLFSGPGFSVSGVIIHEDPRISREPLAYIPSVEARVSFASLWTGRLEFSNLRLDEPSINLVKSREGPWNFEPLLTRAVAAAPNGLPFPAIQVRGGRINFKSGDIKSVFYFTEPAVDILPPSGRNGDWRMRFSGEPARTDRPAYGLGQFSGRGRWHPDARTGGHLDMTLELDRSPIGELVTLIHGHDIGVHGQITSQAHLAGPVSDVQITGRMQISDVHRWDLLPPHGEGWPLEYRGRIDLVSQRLEIDTSPIAGLVLPFSIRYRAFDYLSRPRWGVTAVVTGLPAAPLVEVARHMGVDLPPGVALAGDLSGGFGYSSETGIQGMIGSDELSIKLPDSTFLRLAQASVLLDGTRVRLLPATLLTAQEEEATLEGEYSWPDQALEAKLLTGSMSIAALRSASVALLGTGAVPLLENCQTGEWSGRLEYEGRATEPADWTGNFEIQRARISLPGMDSPLDVASARVALRDGGATVTRMRGNVAGVDFQGEYRYRPKAARPHQFQLVAPKLDAAALERIFLPTIARREGLLARALRLGRTQTPPWLADRHADGRMEIRSFTIAGYTLERLRTRVRWDGIMVDIPELEARLASGAVKGHLSINLRRSTPSYRFAGSCESLEWKGGQWDGDGSIQTGGIGRDVLRNLRAQGVFTARSVELDEEMELAAVSGSYQLTIARGLPRLQFNELQATIGRDVFQGKGTTREDGRVYLDLSDGRRQMQISGTLSPAQFNWQLYP